MTRTARVLPLLLLAPLLLTACGEGGEEKGETAGTGAPAAELGPRARALGIAPELVYVTEAPGFALARQSVGAYGGDGFSATYVSRESGEQLRLYVDRGTISAADCTGRQTVCEEEGDGVRYRSGGGRHEYAVVKEDHVVRLEGDAGVPRDVVRKAAQGVHRPSGEEVAELLPSAPGGDAAPTGPVERGDLPPAGDGAPRNDVDAGG
ncbi:hypothetical protein SUDANB176_05878 [Streptomyces sp. enrichment culture]|uniref:hypothetical protein n=1 Tax=Streptomyces sp. enrichment culture TaxID=1795815 RepID=UPI003F56DD48